MKQGALLSLPTGFEYRLDLARAATPAGLREARRHQWFYFPHSYSPELVRAILGKWALPPRSLVLDPFVGAGTTLLVALEHGMNAIGCDLSPLAVLVSRAKVREYDRVAVQSALKDVLSRVADNRDSPASNDSGRLNRAFTSNELSRFLSLARAIRSQPLTVQGFFWVALLGTAHLFSRAVADGGWFRWTEAPDRCDQVVSAFADRAALMLQDLTDTEPAAWWACTEAGLGDARALGLSAGVVDGMITSPPYPNRHDYTRVFHVELLLLGLREQEIRELRRMSIRSHVETRGAANLVSKLTDYESPESVLRVLRAFPCTVDKRIRPMLKGYFEDLYLTLLEVRRVLRQGGRAAFVIGNARHAGVMVPIDEILADISQLAGLSYDGAWVIRRRGNSAQQMGRFGREPSRESVVFLRKN